MNFLKEFLFPRKTFKIRLVIFLILALVVYTGFLFARGEKTLSGVVLDCITNQPVANVEVSTNQRGWGFIEGSLVWDKDYISKTTTSSSGEFTTTYSAGGTADIKASKEGYITAQQFENPKERMVVRILQGDKPREVTYNCRLSSECLETRIENNVQITRNVCL